MIDILKAKSIMGKNFIGPEELKSLERIKVKVEGDIPEIPFSEDELNAKKNHYLLILCGQNFLDGTPISIRNLKNKLGINPDVSEPCFYNQDWYDKESFIDTPLTRKWLLIRKYVFEDSRAIPPSELENKYTFPSALECTYSFFIAWFVCGVKLWCYDFVWCSDVDHNGDRIYVGKYQDIDGINKNGFSIHRHLSLRNCYGCID